MPINLGDAIISVLVETAQANAQLDQFGASVPQKLAPAAAAFTGTAGAVDGFGTKVQETSSTVDDLTKHFATGAQGAKEVGDVTTLSGEKMKFSMYEARGEVGLLGDAFGIHLPRHVRSFIAELPGVGLALSAAFSATAILFIIDALIKGIEKITEWSEHGEKIARAWEQYDQTIFTSSTHMQAEIDKQEQKLIEMTQGPVAALDFALKHLQTTAFETFALITKDVDVAVKAMNEASSSLIGIQFNVFKDAGKDLTKFRDELQKTMREATQAHTDDPFAAYNAGIALVQQKERELTALITQRTAASGKDASAAIDGLHAERQAVNDMLPLLQQGIRLQQDKIKVLEDTKADKLESDRDKAAKRALDDRLAGIALEKATQHAAFAEGTIDAGQWSLAQSKATNDAAKAKEDYADTLAQLAKQGIDGQKALATVQDASTEKVKEQSKVLEIAAAGLEKAKEATAKLRAEMEKLAFPAEKTHQQTEAFKELESAEKQLAQAQESLAQAQISRDTRDQVATIRNLANLRIISKRTEAATLATIEKQEADLALQELQRQLDGQLDKLDKAKAKFQVASKAFFPDAELAKLKAELDQAQAAVDKTQASMLKLKTGTSDYAKALALATAAGKQELVQQLLQNHAEIDAAQTKLATLRATGLETQAIKDQIKALEHLIATLKKEETQLESNAHKGLSAWKQFSEGFRDESKKNTITLQEMSEKMRRDLQEFAADIGQEFAAMLQGEESFGEAMAHATEKLIGKMAQQWGEYFAAKAIADIFWNPALGAAEFAAAAALFTVGSLMSSLASDSGGKSGSAASAGTPAPAAGSTGSAAGQQPTQTINVVHLASGGLVDKPTLAVIGDSASGGRSREAVIPIDSPQAMAAMHKAFGGGGGTTVNVHVDGMISADNLHQVVKQITRDVNAGRVKLLASNSIRVTRRS